MADIATAATEASPFIAELEAKNLHPLWDRYQRITPIKPQPPDAPFIWRWREVEPLLQRSVGEVSINDIERRALIMAHPAFGAETTTTSTLLAAFTVLDPGERARPHRHTGAAVRFATRAEGAVTIVDGRRCEMKAGDLILTPPMVWHGHINESDHRIIWFDAANMPLIRAVDAHFFEPGDPRNNAFWQVDEGDEALWTEAGLRAEGAAASAVNSPKYRYPGEATRRLLASAPPGADGARMIRYVNPATGGADMPADGISPMRPLWIIRSRDGNPMAQPPRYALARGTVRHVGEPVVAVIAETRDAAADAAERVTIDYEALPAVTDARAAQARGAPQLHEAAPGNVCFRWARGDEAAVRAAFKTAPHKVTIDLVNNRLIGAAIEPRAMFATVEPGTD